MQQAKTSKPTTKQCMAAHFLLYSHACASDHAVFTDGFNTLATLKNPFRNCAAFDRPNTTPRPSAHSENAWGFIVPMPHRSCTSDRLPHTRRHRFIVIGAASSVATALKRRSGVHRPPDRITICGSQARLLEGWRHIFLLNIQRVRPAAGDCNH